MAAGLAALAPRLTEGPAAGGLLPPRVVVVLSAVARAGGSLVDLVLIWRFVEGTPAALWLGFQGTLTEALVTAFARVCVDVTRTVPERQKARALTQACVEWDLAMSAAAAAAAAASAGGVPATSMTHPSAGAP